MVRVGLVLFLLLMRFEVVAGGFQLNLQGAKAQGMAHTGTGIAQGASSTFFNPGALTFLPYRFQSSGTVNFLNGRVAYYDPASDYSAYNVSKILTPFSAYAAYKLHKRISAGFGVYNPFGSSLEWENKWKGRFLVQEISLKTFYFQPTLALKITDKLGIGAGLVVGKGHLYFERDLPITSSEGHRSYVYLDGKAWDVGINAGLFWSPSRNVSFGASYRSGLTFDFEDQEARFFVPFEARSRFPTGNKFSFSLPTPPVYNLGLSIAITPKLLMAADINYAQWSRYKNVHVNFRKNTEVLNDINEPRNYENSVTYRLGLQYTRSCCFVMRAGIAYDNTPLQPDLYKPETPDSDRLILSGGVSYDFDDHFAIDAAYTFVTGRQISANYSPEDFRGVYKFRANVISVGLNYVF